MDLGYALLPEFCGAGYAVEASSAVMAYARRNLNAKRVAAIVNQDNESSMKLLRKLGFEQCGTIRNPGDEKELSLLESVV